MPESFPNFIQDHRIFDMHEKPVSTSIILYTVLSDSLIALPTNCQVILALVASKEMMSVSQW